MQLLFFHQEMFDSADEEEAEMEEMKKEIETLHQWKKTGVEPGKQPKYGEIN